MFPTRTPSILSESALSAPSWYFFPSISNPILHLMHFIPFPLHTRDSHRILPPTWLFHLPVLPFPSQNLCASPWQWQMRATGHYPKFQSCCHHTQHHEVYISPRMSWDIRWSYDSSGAIWRAGELSSKPVNSVPLNPHQHTWTSILDFIFVFKLLTGENLQAVQGQEFKFRSGSKCKAHVTVTSCF